MVDPTKQQDVGNAVLQRVRAKTEQELILLEFDRDVILRDGRLPVVLLDSGLAPRAIPTEWERIAPGVIQTAAPWGMMPGEPFLCFIPENARQIASITGGRVLAALKVGYGE